MKTLFARPTVPVASRVSGNYQWRKWRHPKVHCAPSFVAKSGGDGEPVHSQSDISFSDSFNELIVTNAPWVFRRIKYFVRNQDDSEELAQEIFTRLLMKNVVYGGGRLVRIEHFLVELKDRRYLPVKQWLAKQAEWRGKDRAKMSKRRKVVSCSAPEFANNESLLADPKARTSCNRLISKRIR